MLDNKAILLGAVAEFNRQENREGYFELYASDIVLHRSPPLAPGLEAVKQWYRSLWTAFPDCCLTLGNVLCEGDLLANNFRLTGTHQALFLGVQPTGKRINVEGVTILRFSRGKCIERWSQTDTLTLMRQIGAL